MPPLVKDDLPKEGVPDCAVCPFKEEAEAKKWNWAHFFIGKLSNKFLAWVAYMVLQFMVILVPAILVDTTTVLIISAVVTVIFMLAGALDTAVENAKITANLEAKYGHGTTKTVTEKTVEGGK